MATKSILLYAELLANIRQISIVAELPSPCTSNTTAQLSQDLGSLSVEHDGQKAIIRLPDQVARVLLPVPPAGRRELSWRLPLSATAPGKRQGDFMNDAMAPWSAKKLSRDIAIVCRQCKNILVERGTITCWKDLPSENWAEMMDFWLCHKPNHKHAPGDGEGENLTEKKGYGANNRFIAGSGTGFVDLTYLLLNPENCRGVKFGLESDKLRCTACDALLGAYDKIRSSNRLLKWSLSVNDGGRMELPPLSHFFTAHLVSQISAQAVSKFVVHSASPLTPTLYLWVFAPRLMISLSEINESSVSMPVSKIFYRTVSAAEKDKLVDDTALTSAVEEVVLDEGVVREVEETLNQSSTKLPGAAKKFGEWNVGFLERFEE